MALNRLLNEPGVLPQIVEKYSKQNGNQRLYFQSEDHLLRFLGRELCPDSKASDRDELVNQALEEFVYGGKRRGPQQSGGEGAGQYERRTTQNSTPKPAERILMRRPGVEQTFHTDRKIPVIFNERRY